MRPCDTKLHAPCTPPAPAGADQPCPTTGALRDAIHGHIRPGSSASRSYTVRSRAYVPARLRPYVSPACLRASPFTNPAAFLILRPVSSVLRTAEFARRTSSCMPSRQPSLPGSGPQRPTLPAAICLTAFLLLLLLLHAAPLIPDPPLQAVPLPFHHSGAHWFGSQYSTSTSGPTTTGRPTPALRPSWVPLHHTSSAALAPTATRSSALTPGTAPELAAANGLSYAASPS